MDTCTYCTLEKTNIFGNQFTVMQVKSQLLDIKGMVARKKLENPVYEI